MSARRKPAVRSSHSRSRPSPSHIPEMHDTHSPVATPISVDSLLRGFAEVQKKFSHLLNVIDQKEKVGLLTESLGAFSVGMQSLRDIAAAIIEKDPHFACLNRVFEDLWLVGFTRPLKLSNKLENLIKIQDAAFSLQAWRNAFMLEWQGFLCNLRDMISIYQHPQTALRLLPSLRQTLPAMYATKEAQVNPLNHLPLNYILRDIALCLARTYSHENSELEKSWMRRALDINQRLRGIPYRDAWEQLVSKSEKERQDTPKEQQAVRILGREGDFPYFVMELEPTGQEVVTETEQRREEMEKPVNGAQDVGFTADHGVWTAEPEKPPNGAKSVDYGAVVASQRDLQVLRMFKSRNAFIQGLLQAAEDQGHISPDGNEA
ncbi:uncharacterized protein LOC129597236 [Paramacrobiotus metropolitanus]|uniref:uncharacterized protein LOC129597236 n=1 Tax=Paramacrobiotus metropolitanus TaxID=2943436 RepID=UPI002445F622|nr:uncharacterized protein LOC129597236 [Paramacrobiotus metropolitanus]